MSNASDNESPSQKSQPGTPENAFNWKVSALIGSVLLLSVVVLVETGRWKADWIGISADREISRVEEHTPPTEKGNVSKYTVTTKEIPAKSLWDWLGLLGVPLVLAVLGYGFQDREKKREEKRQEQLQKIAEQNRDKDLKIADDKQKDETLKNYFDSMKELLLDKGLKSSQEGNEVRDVARILTLSVFRQLDSKRNQLVTQFLQESGLIAYKENQSPPVLNFKEAMLNGVDLSGANFVLTDLNDAILDDAILTEIYLVGAHLNNALLNNAHLNNALLNNAHLVGAHLADADLNGADLRGADLAGSVLIFANLSGAIFDRADLSGANLKDAILLGVDLRQAKGLILDQLRGKHPPLLCKVELPDEIPDKDKFKDRDCKKLPEVLKERYPEQFKNLAEAQAYVDNTPESSTIAKAKLINKYIFG
jgi:uncharacterized protein YjbI with pentapeptide repeats